MEPVTDLNYRVLVEARGTLSQAAAALYDAPAPDGQQARYMGVALEACRAADDAIFHALNVIGSYLDDQEAVRVVQMREWEDAPSALDGAKA